MKLINKILLATDFTEDSNDATRVAMHLGTISGGEIVLMNVLPESGIFAPAIDGMKRKAEEILGGLKERFEVEGIKDISVRIVTGEAFHEISNYAEIMGVGLVILGGGRPELDKKPRLGTTAERIIRHCHKPVWVVRPGDSAKITNILCPVDMSEHSARALRNAIRLTRQFGATLHVMHVVRSLSSLHPSWTARVMNESIEEYHYEERERGFEKMLEAVDFHGVAWSKSIHRGDAAKKIIKQAIQNKCQLIVMGSEGRSGISRLLMGSVAAKVARAFPCSILMVKDVDAIQDKFESALGDIWSGYERGQLMLKEGRAEEAIEQFKICISHNQLFSRAWYGLAEAYEQLGGSDEARRCREKAQKTV